MAFERQVIIVVTVYVIGYVLRYPTASYKGGNSIGCVEVGCCGDSFEVSAVDVGQVGSEGVFIAYTVVYIVGYFFALLFVECFDDFVDVIPVGEKLIASAG